MRAPRFCIRLAVAITILWNAPVRAEEPAPPSVDVDPEMVDVYLLTVGRGPQVWAGFGHTIMRVVDRARRTDDNYNWGIFDFKDPSFAWKFYIGDLRYSLAVTDFYPLIEGYRVYEKRRVVQERINLTNAQKLVLLRRLAWNRRPENVHYQYSQFYDNCATKPRDYLDEALGGRLKERLTRQHSTMTFRDHIRSGSNAVWWIYLGLDQLTNDLQEAPIRPWDEMFLPGMLRQHLRDMPAFDDFGLPIASQMLLSDPTVLVDRPDPPIGLNPYIMMLVVVGIPVIGLLVMTFGARREEVAARALGAASVIYGLWCAFWGTSFASNWVGSRYPEVKHNAGLWLMSPLDWTFVAFGLCLLVRGRRPKRLRWVRWLAVAHLAALAVLLAGKATGLIRQDVYGMLASTGALGALYFATVYLRGAAPQAPMALSSSEPP